VRGKEEMTSKRDVTRRIKKESRDPKRSALGLEARDTTRETEKMESTRAALGRKDEMICSRSRGDISRGDIEEDG
jgi:hypothetical protein